MHALFLLLTQKTKVGEEVSRKGDTHEIPIRKTANVLSFLLSGICSFQTIGSGSNNKIKSIRLFPIPMSKIKTRDCEHRAEMNAMIKATLL